MPGKYDHIDFKPPKGAAQAAKRGLELRQKNGGKGGTAVGVARARDLSSRRTLSPETVRRMKAFFDRHQKNRKASGDKSLSEDKGYIAWMLWGGDPGYSWAKKVVKQMDADIGPGSRLSAMAWPKPHDAWKTVRGGVLPQPTEFEGHDAFWTRVAARLGVPHDAGVQQRAPVIGGRRRYHHRPLTTWRLADKRHLTLTTDRMEALSWNRVRDKRHVSMPRVYDVFEIRLLGKKPMWAIVHEALTYPPDPEWYGFIDTFFRWRAMSKDALRPAKPSDLSEFLLWVISPEQADDRAQKRRRQEAIIPFDLRKARDKKIDQARGALISDSDLMRKINWAKSTLSFLKTNKISHRDLDPSNLAKTLRGRTVVTNLAESRSQGKKTGRMGRISGAAAGQESDNRFHRTVEAIHTLLYPNKPFPSTSALLSGGSRALYGLVHMDEHARVLVKHAAFSSPISDNAKSRGLDKIRRLARDHGEKVVDLLRAVEERIK